MTISLNLVRFQALVAGTGSFGVGAADVGCVVPENAYVTTGKVYTYMARLGNQYEYGAGVYDASFHTQARTTIYSSSNQNLKVNFLYAPMVDVYPAPQPVLELLSAPGRPPRGHIFGLTLSSNVSPSATFGIAAGECADVLGTTMLTLPSAITKTTGAWVAGSGNGALDTGSIAINTWYHVFLIERLVITVPTVDVMISTSLTPLPPTGYTLVRRIGSMRTNGSSQWTPFTQVGDDFIWFNHVLDLNNVNLPTSATYYTLTAPINVPIEVFFTAYFTSSAAGNDVAAVWSPYANPADTTVSGNINFSIPSFTSADAKDFRLLANSALGGHIRAKYVGVDTPNFYVNTKGWKDMRGRLL